MSLMAMSRVFKKHGPIFGSILALLMLVGVVFSGFGSNVSSGGGGAQPMTPANAEASVATVGTAKVTRAELEQRLNMLLKQQQMFGGPGQVPPVERERYRFMLLTGLQQEQAAVMAAQKKGVQVTDAQIEAERDKLWQQMRGSIITSLELKETATDAQIETAIAKQAPGLTIARLKQEQFPTDAIRTQLYNQGLTDALKKEVKVSEADVKKSYDEVQVRHILIKSGDGGLPDGQAKTKAEKILKEVQADPSKMPALAKQYSDDPGSKDKGGLYDWAPASNYVPEFAKASLEVGVGKVYPEPVKTQFGYHIIKGEGVRPGKAFPKDWDKEKQKYIDQYAEREASKLVQKVVEAEVPNVKIEVTDPSLKASEYEDAARKATDEKIKNTNYEQALAELAKVKKEDDPYGIVPLRKAQIYGAMKKSKEAIAAYEEALNSANTIETRLALANLYLGEKDKAAATKQLEESDKLAVPDPMMMFQIAGMWDQVGQKDKAKLARDKAQEILKRQMEMQQAQMQPPTAPAPSASPAPQASPATAASPAPAASPAAAAPAAPPAKP